MLFISFCYVLQRLRNTDLSERSTTSENPQVLGSGFQTLLMFQNAFLEGALGLNGLKSWNQNSNRSISCHNSWRSVRLLTTNRLIVVALSAIVHFLMNGVFFSCWTDFAAVFYCKWFHMFPTMTPDKAQRIGLSLHCMCRWKGQEW